MKKSLALLLACAPCALAQGPPPPAPELAQLKTFDGSFACTGHTPASPTGPAHKTEASVKGGADLNGYWFSMRYEEKKTAENPAPVAALLIWGYDSTQKKFSGTGLDSFGGLCHQTSAGWEGDSLVMAGECLMGGQKIASRDTFGRKGTTITHKGELQMDGKWVLLDEETCTRK